MQQTTITSVSMFINSKMYYYRAIWKYFCDINMFNAAFCSLVVMLFGVSWGLLMFCTIGILIGRYGFKVFKNDEYYMYYNLGFTKKALLIKIFYMNLLICLPFLLLMAIF